MATELLESLRVLLAEDLDSIEPTASGLTARADARYGELLIRMDYEEDGDDSAALRVYASVPPPAGGGHEFLLFCLATNIQYWGVKIGLEEDGHLSIHADVEVDDSPKLLAADVLDRVESILQLLDEDMVEYCLDHLLGTPAQRARWTERRPSALDQGDPED